MSNSIKGAVRSRFNIRKAVTAIATAGWVQVIITLALGLMYFTRNAVGTMVLLGLLLAFMLLSNYVLMKRSLVILSAERSMNEVEATLESATELNRKIRSQRHDFMNHLQVVHALMELGEYRDAQDYIDKVYKDIQSVSRLLRTDNAAVNALLVAKTVDAGNRGVAMEFDIRSRVTNLAMEPWEFCGILGNIIDNALDALEETKDAKIRVHLWEELGSFNFAIENNGPEIAVGILERIFEPGFTTKGEHGQGLGLHIVRETVEKYGGSIDVVKTGPWMRFTGTVPIRT